VEGLNKPITTAALIPAAGQGERLGKGPKAFLPLGERSILQETMLAFAQRVDEMIIAVSEAMLVQTEAYQEAGIRVITGGATRQETVFLLLQQTSAEIVLIHDAARPFLSAEIVLKSIAAAKEHKAATVVKAVSDTLIKAEDGRVIDRSLLRAVQTPQSFSRELILEAHRYAHRQGIEATDDAALVRLLGHPVALVEGDAWLDKITTAADYERAQALVKTWHGKTQ
jgi:2-C-methyl-D-erythritol 4-phosphate cytidylyltransferase